MEGMQQLTPAGAPQGYEYLDHTADVQLHAWGSDVTQAFEQAGLALMNYMVALDNVEAHETRTVHVEGNDLESLLHNFLDELLFIFATQYFLCCQLHITALDRDTYKIAAVGAGERFDRAKHEIGTEIKAVTYSAMRILESEGHAELFVIVDI